MAKEDLSNISTEELIKSQKQLRLTVILIGSAIILTAISSIVLSIRRGANALNVLPICFLAMVTVFAGQLKKVNREIKRRSL